jgi:hypothetical protein
MLIIVTSTHLTNSACEVLFDEMSLFLGCGVLSGPRLYKVTWHYNNQHLKDYADAGLMMGSSQNSGSVETRLR